MREQTRKRVEDALANRNHLDERERVEAWGFLLAMLDHFPSLAPKGLRREPPKDLDLGRLIKQRRIAIARLAKEMAKN